MSSSFPKLIIQIGIAAIAFSANPKEKLALVYDLGILYLLMIIHFIKTKLWLILWNIHKNVYAFITNFTNYDNIII